MRARSAVAATAAAAATVGLAETRQSPERKREIGGDDRRRPERLVVGHLAVAQKADRERVGEEGEAEHDRAALDAGGKRGRDAAEQPRERERAQAGGAFAFRLRAHRPAALDAEHETNRKCDGETLQKLEMVGHR